MSVVLAMKFMDLSVLFRIILHREASELKVAPSSIGISDHTPLEGYLLTAIMEHSLIHLLF